MNGRIEPPGAPAPQHAARHGRHRRGAGTWTPAVPGQHEPGQHSGRFDQAHYGQLALDSREGGTDRFPRPDPGYRASSGVLPVPPPALSTREPRDPAPALPPLPSQRGDLRDLVPPISTAPSITAPSSTDAPPKPIRRTKVTLTPPEPEPQPDAMIYLTETEPDGLSTFDLGSVPASVTPPRTWRKAAWFATVSSGGVVVAMLFAGSFLVGQPAGSQVISSWPGENGTNPALLAEPPSGGTELDAHAEPALPGDRPSNEKTTEDGTPQRTSPEGTPSTPGRSPTTPGSDRPGSARPPSSPASPQKPPVKPAKREVEKPRYWNTNNPQAMADNSEKFLNTVTENPAAAAELTEGDLREEGPDGLRQNYSDVAYFEVKHIYVDPNDGITVNTVEVTREDGTKTTEQRVLVFGENDRIADDGR